MQHSIYVLKDPGTQAIRYVGVTCVPLAQRLSGHLNRAKSGGNNHRCRWLRRLIGAGLRPTIHCIETVSEASRVTREQYWIAFYRAQGCSLVNATEGGEGCLGYRLPQESIERMRAKKLGQKLGPRDPEISKKIGEKLRGRPLCEEHKRKLSERHKGQKLSEDTCRKLSEAHRGHRHSAETLARMRKPKTETHRRNATAALNALRAAGLYRATRGDANGLRKHPESVLRGANNPLAKLADVQVIEMRRLYALGKTSTPKLAKQFNVSQGTAWRIVNGLSWKHLL